MNDIVKSTRVPAGRWRYRIACCCRSCLSIAARAAVVTAVVAAAACQSTAGRTTGVLINEPGHVGDELGAVVRDSYLSEDGAQQVIEVEIPVEPASVHGIEVLEADSPAPKPAASVEVDPDYDSNKVGVRVYLTPGRRLEFRLRLAGPEPDEE